MHGSLEWPHGKLAAVSLSYDDGNENNLDNAMPDLEAKGFLGTFYLQVGRADVNARAADWRAAHDRGHEIGNHTVHHPCRVGPYLPNVPSWLVNNALEDFTPQRIQDEIAEAARWLDQKVGPDPDRTFCYPCGHTEIGDPPDEASYLAAIRRFHFAARHVHANPNDPANVDLMKIGCAISYGETATSEYLTACCDAALPARGTASPGLWTVLCFHGIGGESHPTPREVHQAVIAHLSRGPFWVAPVKTVARHIESVRAKP
jgi:peptidoglycan/xylan/chitin deacetylase (PgdA/CDA1 family)